MFQKHRLKQLRKNMKLTQEELGKMVNVTKVSICCYETGKRTPNLDTLVDLSNVLGVDSDYLLGREINVVAEDEEPYYRRYSKEELIFLDNLRKNAKIRDKILEDPSRFSELVINKTK